jgi:hypothetical protein
MSKQHQIDKAGREYSAVKDEQYEDSRSKVLFRAVGCIEMMSIQRDCQFQFLSSPNNALVYLQMETVVGLM